MAKHHLEREIENLKKRLLTLGAYVEESLRAALTAFEKDDVELAKKVMGSDREIDFMEVEVEEEGLKILALHQPVATDLRFIVAVLKINNDLERIGDLAVNICKQVEIAHRHNHDRIEIDVDLLAMGQKAQAMLHKSLDAVVNLDTALAQEVILADDEVDILNQQMHSLVEAVIQKGPECVRSLLHLLKVSQNLERVADQATNIAEDVIYMVEGDIVRHRLKNRLMSKDENS